MEKPTSLTQLNELIYLLEVKQAEEKFLLNQEFKTTIESLRPVNLIKNTFSDFVAAPDLKGRILDAALSVATGFLSKKILVGSTHNPIKQVFGSLLQVGVTALVSQNADGIKSTATNLIKKIFTKKRLLPR